MQITPKEIYLSTFLLTSPHLFSPESFHHVIMVLPLHTHFFINAFYLIYVMGYLYALLFWGITVQITVINTIKILLDC